MKNLAETEQQQQFDKAIETVEPICEDFLRILKLMRENREAFQYIEASTLENPINNIGFRYGLELSKP